MPSATPSLTLAYLVLEVARPAAWERFRAEMLGLPAPARDPAGRLARQIDDPAPRLVVEPGPRDELKTASGLLRRKLVGRGAATGAAR